MHIYLTGFMGAGKTTVGRCLANDLGWDFLDLDDLIERHSSMTISEIFEHQGEPEFRQMEKLALCQISRAESVVIATGGGIMVDAKNRSLMNERGVTVWLNVSFRVIESRMHASDLQSRPLYKDTSQAKELFEKRTATFELCGFRVDVSPQLTAQEVANSVCKLLREAECDI